jgi:hypothetical protein
VSLCVEHRLSSCFASDREGEGLLLLLLLLLA